MIVTREPGRYGGRIVLMEIGRQVKRRVNIGPEADKDSLSEIREDTLSFQTCPGQVAEPSALHQVIPDLRQALCPILYIGAVLTKMTVVITIVIHLYKGRNYQRRQRL